MFSVEHLLAILGDPALGDRLEKMAYNALPGAFDGDDVGASVRPAAQPGAVQPAAATLDDQRARVERVRPRAELRLLHGQLPSGLAEARVQSVDGARPTAVSSPRRTRPSEVRTTVARECGGHGGGGDGLSRSATPSRLTRDAGARRRVPAALLRVPAWATGAEIAVNGAAQPDVRPGHVPSDRADLEAGRPRQLRLPMRGARIALVQRLDRPRARSAGVLAERSAKTGASSRSGMKNPAPRAGEGLGSASDDAVELRARHRAATNATRAVDGGREGPSGRYRSRPGGAPVELTVEGRRLPAWAMVDGSADAPPRSPVTVSAPDRDADAHPLRIRQAADHRISSHRTGAAVIAPGLRGGPELVPCATAHGFADRSRSQLRN